MKDQVRQFIVNELLDGKTVSDGEELLLSGLVDSLGVMRLVAYLEGLISAPVPPADITIEHFSSIDGIVAYVQSRRVSDVDSGGTLTGAAK